MPLVSLTCLSRHLKQNQNHHGFSAPSKQGQSLVELVLVAVVLVPILFGSAYVGMAMYQGSLASSAIKAPLTHRSEMAGKNGTVGVGELAGWATAEGSNSNSGNVDAVSTQGIGQDDMLMVGSKTSVSIPVIGSITFTVHQPIQAGLLLANTGSVGLEEYDPNTTPRPIEVWDDIPARLRYNPGCAGRSYGNSTVDKLTPQPTSYINYKQAPGGSSRFAEDAIMQLANVPRIVAACAGEVGVCDAEREFLEYKFSGGAPTRSGSGSSATFSLSRTHNNPPGRPGYEAIYTCSGSVSVSNTAQVTGTSGSQTVVGGVSSSNNMGQCSVSSMRNVKPAEYGLYKDPSGQFIEPPASFVPDCQARRRAECQLREALSWARAIEDRYRAESSCQ